MRSRSRGIGLQGWLIAAFVGVGVLASIAMLLVLLPALETSVRNEQAPREARQLRERITEIGASAPLPAEPTRDDLRELAVEVRVAVGGQARVVYWPQALPFLGEVRVQAPHSADLLEAAPHPFSPVSGVSIGEGAVWGSAPLIGAGGQVTGYLAAAAPLRGVAAELAIVERRVIVAMLVVLGLASLLGTALARLIGRRLRRLAATASTLAAGDLSARAPASGPQELDTLAESLNGMAGRLQGLIGEITTERDRDRAMLASLAEGVLAVGPEGEVTVANGAAERLLRLDADAGPVRLDALPAPVRDVVRSELARPGTGMAEHEVTLRNGTELELYLARLGAERSAGVVLTLRDVTEERRLARARRDLVANVSHELKTPLAALKGFLELLEDEQLDPRHRGEFVALMSHEASRLERLIEEQLQLARLDAGALPLERESVDLGALATEAVAPQAVLAREAGVALEVDAPPGPVCVDADPARVEQMLVILLDNALRHTGAGGRVTVAVRREREHERERAAGLVSVRDTGSGIPAEEQPFVFDRFYRGDTAREGHSAGLGLAIARGLAEAHGGGIELRSLPGIGSTFVLRLPLADPEPAEAGAEAALVGGSAVRPPARP